MFEDLVPSAQAQTPAPPPGLFDDLIPAGGATSAAAKAGVPHDDVPEEVPSGLAAAITDIPREVSATTREAWGNLRRALPSSLGGERNMASEGPLESLGRTGKGLLAAAALPFAPVQGVGRSLLGHSMVAADQGLRRGAVGLYGEDKVRAAEQATGQTPGGMTYDEARRHADTLAGLIAPRRGLAGGRNPAPPAPQLPTPETPSPQQIVENKAAIADSVRDVGVPPERIDQADIDGFARSVSRRDLLTFTAFRRSVIDDALKRGLVTPEEIEQIYGKGAADEYRGTSTPENGAVAPPQGAQGGGPGGDTPQGQQLPGPGENSGEARGPTTAGPSASPRSVEPGRPDEPQPTSAPESAAPNDAARPEETARPDEITSEADGTGRGDAKQSANAAGDQQPPERRPDEPPPPPPVVARLTGDELGRASSLPRLRGLALSYARENLVNQSVTNKQTGFAIRLNWAGLRKSLSGRRGHDLMRLTPAIPQMLEHGVHIAEVADIRGRPDVKAMHLFASAAELAGVRHDTILFVRELRNGHFFYDFGIRRGPGMPGAEGPQSQVRSPGFDTPDRE